MRGWCTVEWGWCIAAHGIVVCLLGPRGALVRRRLPRLMPPASSLDRRPYCRPSIVLSYVFSGIAAILAACCYAELCVEFPVAGGAFSYVMVGASLPCCSHDLSAAFAALWVGVRISSVFPHAALEQLLPWLGARRRLLGARPACRQPRPHAGRAGSAAGAWATHALASPPFSILLLLPARWQATFGELAAVVTLGGLVLEYVVGMAAVARGFSRQLARLCNQDPQHFVSAWGSACGAQGVAWGPPSGMPGIVTRGWWGSSAWWRRPAAPFDRRRRLPQIINIGGEHTAHFFDIMVRAGTS